MTEKGDQTHDMVNTHISMTPYITSQRILISSGVIKRLTFYANKKMQIILFSNALLHNKLAQLANSIGSGCNCNDAFGEQTMMEQTDNSS